MEGHGPVGVHHMDEEAFWAEMHDNQEQERREYEERIRQQQQQQRGRAAPLVGVAEGLKGLLKAVAANSGETWTSSSSSSGDSSRRRPLLGVELSSSSSHYRMMEDDKVSERGEGRKEGGLASLQWTVGDQE